jgi:hypothetical protein
MNFLGGDLAWSDKRRIGLALLRADGPRLPLAVRDRLYGETAMLDRPAAPPTPTTP